MTNPVTLYNQAALSILVPTSASLPTPPPPRSTLAAAAPSSSPRVSDEAVDRWITSLLDAPQRTRAYYDETLTFYLLMTLPPRPSPHHPSLSRSQAHSFFLDSLPEPHLTLHASLSYYEAAADRQPRQLRAQPAYPLPPHPDPTTTDPTPTVDHTTRDSVLVSTRAFSDRHERDDEEESQEPPRVWVGQTREGNWVGLWEFASALPSSQTPFREPKLALTVTVTFRDDPRLDRILSLQDTDPIVNGARLGSSLGATESEEEEYMDDSYDDVNLLSSLGTSHSFHLPFSRLPQSFLPPLSIDPPPSHARRHSRNRSLEPGEAQRALNSTGLAPLPLLRRSVLKTFELRKPIRVSIRTIDCSTPDPNAIDSHEDEREQAAGGMVVLLELLGPTADGESFEIEEIEVKAGSSKYLTTNESTRGSHVSDVDVKRIRTGTSGEADEADAKIQLGLNDQYNIAYKLALSPSSQLVEQQQQDLSLSLTSRQGLPSVPIQVATSPSQRFTARFGTGEEDEQANGHEQDELNRRNARDRDSDRQHREELFTRNLQVSIRGNVLTRNPRQQDIGGYTVENENDTLAPNVSNGWSVPTGGIRTICNYTIDISSFAYRQPPLQARFLPISDSSSSTRPLVRPSSIAAPHIPLLPPSALRPIPAVGDSDRAAVDSIAGSKRHTMASLASLSLRSPVLSRKNSVNPLPAVPPPNTRSIPQRHSSSRISTTPSSLAAPPGPASGATGPRRFFSLPPQSQEPVAGSTRSTPTNANFLTNRQQTETPPPIASINAIAPSVARNSLSLPNGSNQTEGSKRTSWISGLGIGKSSVQNSVSRNEGGTSWDTISVEGRGNREIGGLGLGFDGSEANSPLPPLPPHSSLPPRPSEIDSPEYYQYSQPVQDGRILVTVSLVPLRAVKSRRQLKDVLGNSEAPRVNNDLPPATLPGLESNTSSRARRHASFNFPSSSPSSPTLPSPISSPQLDRDETSNSFTDAEKAAYSTSRMPRVGLLDVFLVQLFVVNQTNQIKRFVVEVPPPSVRRNENSELLRQGPTESRFESIGRARARVDLTTDGQKEQQFAKLVPLENHVRIGPLVPNSCASLGLRMLAISPGAHLVDELKLVDLADGSETRLEKPLWVVVE